MKRFLLPLLAALALPTDVNAKTYYLLIQTNYSNPAFAVIPMESKAKCEESGVLYITSARLKNSLSTRGFECFEGK